MKRFLHIVSKQWSEMRIKILTALISSIALGSQFSYGQNHASREMDCSEINSLIVSDALLNVCGEESVALWLDKNALLVGSITVDINGFAKSLHIVRDLNIGLSRKEKRKIIKYLKANKVTFKLCDNHLSSMDMIGSCDSIPPKKSNLHRDKRIIIGFDFNGASMYWMFHHGAEHDNTNKIEILKRNIRLLHNIDL